MFGTVARLRVKPGAAQDLINLGEKWGRERGAATGQVAQYLFRLDSHPDEFMLVAAFRSRDAYRKNADDPETDRRYQEMRKLLQSDPEWNDGEIIETKVVDAV
jgi:quinol monooxygenase YgiN